MSKREIEQFKEDCPEFAGLPDLQIVYLAKNFND